MSPLMISVRVQLVAMVVLLLTCAIAGYLAGVHTSAPLPEIMEPAAAQSQPDRSVVAERAPEARLGPVPHIIPKGATEERRMSVTVQPRQKSRPPVAATVPIAASDPVRVDLSLVRMDGGRRVIASSPDGDVVGALDVPIEPAPMPISRPWAAGLSCDPGRCRETPGAWIDRDLGRVRVGAELARHPEGGSVARVRLGWVW